MLMLFLKFSDNLFQDADIIFQKKKKKQTNKQTNKKQKQKKCW